LHFNGFQDRRDRPLCHLSFWSYVRNVKEHSLNSRAKIKLFLERKTFRQINFLPFTENQLFIVSLYL